ncbi:MAG: prolyl oligopeptidase family serine peptidase [Bacteroidales bacterium]
MKSNNKRDNSRKIKLNSTLVILFIFILSPFLLKAQTLEDLEKKISSLSNQVSNLKYTHDKILKQIDDINWVKRLEDFAYVDKVRMTGPPSKSTNSTGKGVGNPTVFWSYVFIPNNIDLNKKYPLIVFPHGGVHGNFGIGNIHVVKELILQGYVIVAPEYRGSTGYGKGFQQKIDYGALEIDDSKASRDYMLENYDFLDKNRVGIMGWSHGGMHALLNVFNYPDSYTVAYAGVPVSDLIMRLGYMNDSYRRLFSASYHIGKEVFQNVKEYRRRSPAFNAHKLKTPLLIHANTNDDDVLIEEVEHLISALKANNKKFDYQIYEDFPGGHHFDRIDSYGAKEVRLKVYKYLEKHLNPESPFRDLKDLIRQSYFPIKEK